MYCSARCKDRAARERAIADGRYAEWEATSAARRAAKRDANRKPCPYCGALMDSVRRVQCGAPECQRRFNNERTAEFRRQYKERTGTHFQYQYKPHHKTCETCGEPFDSREARIRFCSISCGNASRTWSRECVTCGRTWESGRPDSRFCSGACRNPPPVLGTDLVLWHRVPQWVIAAEAARRFRWLSSHPLRKCWYAGRCACCGEPFIHDQPQTRTCSLRCARKLGKAARRAVLLEAFVEAVSPYRIFERDRWRCQLCRKPVARTKRVPHPKAPVLDHIVPLAAGGTHEPANVQCAHFLCNCLKGSGGGGEQLLLIG